MTGCRSTASRPGCAAFSASGSCSGCRAPVLCKEGAQAILTGENLGQVASQTLANLAVIADATTVTVLRPLITYDKVETIILARKIGTFMEKQGDLACRAVPRMPATAATIRAVRESEKNLGIDGLLDTVPDGCSMSRHATGRSFKIYHHDGLSPLFR